MDYEKDEMHILNRWNLPTKFNMEPFGSQWRVTTESVCYVQVSRDEMNPRWIRIADLFEGAFTKKLENAEFMLECINLYLQNA